MNGIKKFWEIVTEYTNNFSALGIILLIIDCLIASFVIVSLYKLLKIKFYAKKVLIILGVTVFLYILCFVFQFQIALTILNFVIFWSFGIIIIIYNQDIKHFFDSTFHHNRSDNSFSTDEEKQEVIDILINTSSYLSKRKIGALITIEREDSLNTIIDKAIAIKGNISQELLTTIFTVGTAMHDGAVIVRKNRIMCAGAYLPSTDKYDVPKSLGTRHRAAIGVSERYDAITIVVSEETGQVSVTADGVINLDLNENRLKEMLERYLIVK